MGPWTELLVLAWPRPTGQVNSPRLTRRRGSLSHPEALSPCAESLSQGAPGGSTGASVVPRPGFGLWLQMALDSRASSVRDRWPWALWATLLTLRGTPQCQAQRLPSLLLRLGLWLPQEVIVLAAPPRLALLRAPAALSLFWALGCQLGWEGPAPHPHLRALSLRLGLTRVCSSFLCSPSGLALGLHCWVWLEQPRASCSELHLWPLWTECWRECFP